ncbi:MAG: GHKL domain-containing protein [Betaproteobacteria bacterium]|nr:GHKL domain-containing protein [Betaproteobacteria bacterium]
MRSLSTRVTVSAGLVLAVFIALSALALERAFRESARAARQERLLAQVYLLIAATEVDASGQITLGSGAMEPRLDLPASGLYAAIKTKGDAVLWKSRSHLSLSVPVGPELPAGEKRFEERVESGNRYFVQSYGISWAVGKASYPFTFSVAEDTAPFQEQLAAYRQSLWSWLGGMAVLLLAAQWLVLRWGLNPLRKVAHEIKLLQQGGKEKVEGNYPTELNLLTENLNTLLLRERAQQRRYRDALADLAHSLKTPLALIRGATSDKDADLQASLDEHVDRMDKIVSYHLQRAATSGKRALATPIPLHGAVRRTLNAVLKVHADKSLQSEIDIGAEIAFRGDNGDLMEILGNVLDNACKWAKSRVRVRSRAENQTLRIEIEDDGPGIPGEDAHRIMERGVRLDQSTPGQGIGLALTRDIVDAYAGRVSIERGSLGGACIVITLPAA